MTTAEFLSVLSDVAVGGAAAIGAVVAWRGLNTWKDQLKGTVEYELARRILAGVYRVRDAVAGVRHSFMSVEEMPHPPEDDAKGMSRDERQYYGHSRAYQARWDRVLDARRGLDPDLLEAEVLWGKDLHNRNAPLRALESELFVAIRNDLELRNPATSEAKCAALEKIVQKRRDIMYDSLSEDDAFANEYLAAVREIEDYLRPHLRRP